MKVGDLVMTDTWLSEYGKYGIVVKIQKSEYCKGVYVLFSKGLHLVRLGNLKVVNESR